MGRGTSTSPITETIGYERSAPTGGSRRSPVPVSKAFPATAARRSPQSWTTPEGVAVDGRQRLHRRHRQQPRAQSDRRRKDHDVRRHWQDRLVPRRRTGDLGDAVQTDGGGDGEDGNDYIADFLHYRVRKVNPGGMISTIAGTGAAGSSGDGGRATAAELIPTSVAVDRERNVYIGDFHNDRVRKVTPGGRITTFAGIGSAVRSGTMARRTQRSCTTPAQSRWTGKETSTSPTPRTTACAKSGRGRARRARYGQLLEVTARKLVERLRLGEAGFTTEPVANVLCGSFTGPGAGRWSRRSPDQRARRLGRLPRREAPGGSPCRARGACWRSPRPGPASGRRWGASLQATRGVAQVARGHASGAGTASALLWALEARHRPQGEDQAYGRLLHLASSRNLSREMAGSSVYCQSVERPHSVRMGLDGRLSVCPGTRPRRSRREHVGARLRQAAHRRALPLPVAAIRRHVHRHAFREGLPHRPRRREAARIVIVVPTRPQTEGEMTR